MSTNTSPEIPPQSPAVTPDVLEHDIVTALDGQHITAESEVLGNESLPPDTADSTSLIQDTSGPPDQTKDRVDVNDNDRDLYYDVPFRTRHYFNNYVWTTSEASLVTWLSKKRETDPESQSWTFILPIWRGEGYKYQLVHEYLDNMEIQHWAQLIKELPTEVFNQTPELRKHEIMHSLDNLRHATVHRQNFQFEGLRSALRLTEFLGDRERAYEIQQVWNLIIHPDRVDEEKGADYKDMLFQRHIPDKSSTQLQVASHIVKSLEGSCYRFAKFHDPRVLLRFGISMQETGEIQEYRQAWAGFIRGGIEPNPKLEDCKYLDGQLFSQRELRTKVLREVRKLTDHAAHRNAWTNWKFCRYVRSAILLAILLKDRRTALEVELLAEQWLTQRTRYQVLLRLEKHYHEYPEVKSKKHGMLIKIIKERDGESPNWRDNSTESLTNEPPTAQGLMSSTINLADFISECNNFNDERENRPEGNSIYRFAIQKFVDCDSMHRMLRPFDLQLWHEVPERQQWMRDELLNGISGQTDEDISVAGPVVEWSLFLRRLVG